MNEICGDNRFEIIAKAKEHLLDATNIDASEDEMKVLDSFLFSCWQMGWLDRYAEPSDSEKPNNCETCKWGEWYRKGYDITMMDDECGGCCSWNSKWTPKDEPRHSGEATEMVEPQTDYRIDGTIGYKCPKCGRGNFLKNEPNCVYCGEPLIKTDCAWK